MRRKAPFSTALLLKDKRVGLYCLLLILIAHFFSNAGPLAFMTGQDFLVRHSIGEVLIGSTAVWCIGTNWRGFSIVVLSMVSLSYYAYEHYMWFDYTPTYKYFELINQVLFMMIVSVLWIKSQLRRYVFIRHYFRKMRMQINQLRKVDHT